MARGRRSPVKARRPVVLRVARSAREHAPRSPHGRCPESAIRHSSCLREFNARRYSRTNRARGEAGADLASCAMLPLPPGAYQVNPATKGSDPGMARRMYVPAPPAPSATVPVGQPTKRHRRSRRTRRRCARLAVATPVGPDSSAGEFQRAASADPGREAWLSPDKGGGLCGCCPAAWWLQGSAVLVTGLASSAIS